VINRIKALNEGSKQLAQGDFDVVVDENIGILSPVATNLNNIKNGFKLAIDKEITSEKMKTELISNVSHDLKTPLTSIITYVDLLKSENLTEENRKEYIDILDRKSKRLKGLIEDLFEASKASSGNVELQLEKLDVVALFKQTLGELEEKINNSTLQMKIAAPENKILCNLDGRRTYRIFENIMTNILKYSMENTRVYITIVEDEQEVSFTFKNISSYEMNFSPEEITERFTRGDRARNTEGSGLGLAIAKSLIVLQRGTLNIEVDGDLFKLKVTFPKAKQI
jgi:signal transduction histidine kinase